MKDWDSGLGSYMIYQHNLDTITSQTHPLTLENEIVS